ncbi:pyruvate kinase [Candidatus Saccharibacteria bacterium]|nr:pyruvate kinase [Candidatus Saccharibacteria bacterium]
MSKFLFKRTKILATIGPSVFTEEKITDLIMAGVNGCRLNFSHGNNTERDQHIKWIRDAAAKKGRSVAILQDLQGPKIRLGEIKNNHMDVKKGDELILDSAVEQHDGSHILPVQYNLAERMKVGEPLYMFDGKIRTTVKEIVSKTAIKVVAENDGFIMSKKGLNLPDTDFGGDILTEKDMADIEFGASRDFDYVALSFVQCADDVEKLRQILLSHGSTAQIIAKIETKKAIETDESLEAIVKATDGIMIARGDMAVEAGAEVVPVVQRKLIALCRKYGKMCIVATQMMSSMVESPEPSRAEVSDVANAVIQGVDAVMLSDETANGKYPIETVKAMKKVILYTQNNTKMVSLNDEIKSDESYDAISKATTDLAEKIDADVIICQTSTGATAAAIAAQRPNLPIITVTSSPRVAGQLALTYANSAFVRPYSENYGLELAQELKENGYLQKRENRDNLTAVIVSGIKSTAGGTNTIRVRNV